MKLLVFGHNDWWVWSRQGFCTRNAALVLALSRRPEIESVVVVDAPRYSSRTHRPAAHRGEELTPVAPGIAALRYAYPLPLPARSDAGRRLNDALTRRRLFAACRHAVGRGEVVVWVADPRLARPGAGFGGDLLVFDAIDDWRYHPWAGRRLTDDGYRTMAAAADLTFAVNQTLLDTLSPAGRGQTLFNAIDPDLWADVRPDPAPIEGLPRPVVGYVGTLQARVDPGLVVATAKAFPEATFVLAGPSFRGFALTADQTPANVRLLGGVPHARVPGLLAALDACFMPHVRGGLASTMDPLKLYEYLAAGRPTVSTLTPPNPRLGPHVRVVGDGETMAAALRQEIAADDAGHREQRRAAVAAETWTARAEEVAGVLGECLAAKRKGAA